MKVAHIAPDNRTQTVMDHDRNVAELAGKFADKFGMKELAEQAGGYHDVGKTADVFQRRIIQNIGRCDHSTAGAVELCKGGDMMGAICVAGHHAGLPDFGTRVDTSTSFRGRVQNFKPAEGYEAPPAPSVHSDVHAKGMAAVVDSIKIRMLYSCLVDADYLDTERFMTDEQRPSPSLPIPALLDKFDTYTQKWADPQTDLNKTRTAILSNCREKGRTEQPGIFSLSIPTGGGKTTAALGFALEHAKAFNKDRVIYLAPYISILEQNAEVFREILGNENVLECHSSYVSKNKEDEVLEQLLSENWDSSVVVSTMVQFFEALYGNKPGQCRKLHNIANSVIIIDEAQQIPTGHLIPCTKAIEELVKNYNATVIFCTATLPTTYTHFFDTPVKEIETNYASLFDSMKRTNLKLLPDNYQLEDKLTPLAEEISKHDQVLCIVNTRKSALELYEKLAPNHRYCLTTYMYPAHRSAVLAEIRDRLEKGLPVQVVSTSLIEAGVDVDFPVVYRELAGLDNILQASGRCNREGKAGAEESTVYISPLLDTPPMSLNMSIGGTRHVLANPDLLLDSLDALNSYYKCIVNYYNDEKYLDQCGAISSFVEANPTPLPFASVARSFHLIGDNTIPVYINTPDSSELIQAIEDCTATRLTMRKLGRYAVNVTPSMAKKMKEAGDVAEVNGVLVLQNQSLYIADTGLKV